MRTREMKKEEELLLFRMTLACVCSETQSLGGAVTWAPGFHKTPAGPEPLKEHIRAQRGTDTQSQLHESAH